ncbi:MAG: hypothetical protein KAG95_03085 [Bacteroidales bacterium]|nr:hypothetical protein [Bacteroidales bacterium]
MKKKGINKRAKIQSQINIKSTLKRPDMFVLTKNVQLLNGYSSTIEQFIY